MEPDRRAFLAAPLAVGAAAMTTPANERTQPEDHGKLAAVDPNAWAERLRAGAQAGQIGQPVFVRLTYFVRTGHPLGPEMSPGLAALAEWAEGLLGEAFDQVCLFGDQATLSARCSNGASALIGIGLGDSEFWDEILLMLIGNRGTAYATERFEVPLTFAPGRAELETAIARAVQSGRIEAVPLAKKP